MKKLWVIALSVWLVLYGILTISNLHFDGQNLIMGVLVILSGILLLMDR